MPPVPLDFTELPLTRNPRMRLNFGQSSACESSKLTTYRSSVLNILQNEANGNAKDVKESVKRPAETLDMAPAFKRRRFQHLPSTPESESRSETPTMSPLSSIIQAVDKLSTESDLVADGSRANILPTIQGKHSDLSAISSETMYDAMDGVYNNRVDKVTIIDCRYPYEYEGGHIKGAINLYTKDAVKKFLQETVTSSTTNHVLIFHCEFSSERGPKMYRILRSLDRDMNKDNYPRLNFSEIYLLEGGYKAFFYTNKEQCFPQTYKPMLQRRLTSLPGKIEVMVCRRQISYHIANWCRDETTILIKTMPGKYSRLKTKRGDMSNYNVNSALIEVFLLKTLTMIVV